MQMNKGSFCEILFTHTLSKRGKCANFTLVELIIVVVLVVIGTTLFAALLDQNRAQATRTACLNNMKQLSVMASQYFDSNNERLVAYDRVTWPGKGQWGCRFIDSGLIKDIKQQWKHFVCPQVDYSLIPQKNIEYCFTNWGYGMNSGWIVEDKILYCDRDKDSPYLEGYKSSNQSGAIVRDRVRQPDNVILFAETTNSTAEPRKGHYLVDLRKGGFWDVHNVNRCNVVFLDGHAVSAASAEIAKSGFPLKADDAPGTIKKINKLSWYTSGGKFR